MHATETASRYRWVILALILVVQWSGSLAGQVLAPLAPLFQPELGLTKAEVGLFASATFAGAWSVLLIAGSLSDRFGVKWVMALGQLATGVLLLCMALVGSVFQAAAVMFVAGMTRASIFPGSSKAILLWFAPSARATAMGIKQAGMPLAGIVTASTLPALGLAFGWRTAIAMVGLSVIVAGLFTAVAYREPVYPGQAPVRRVSMRAGLSEVVRNRHLWAMCTIPLLYVIVQLGLISYLALYFKEVVLVSSVPEESARIVAAGGILAFCQTGGALGRVFWGFVSDRLFGGRRAVVLAGVGSLSVVGTVAVAYLDPNYPSWLLMAIVFACGLSAVGWNGVYHAMITETVGRKYAATGLGFAMTVVEFGTVVGPPVFGLVVDAAGSYRPAWLMLTFLSAAGAAVSLLVARGEKRGP
jgi:sugar phosphate permease